MIKCNYVVRIAASQTALVWFCHNLFLSNISLIVSTLCCYDLFQPIPMSTFLWGKLNFFVLFRDFPFCIYKFSFPQFLIVLSFLRFLLTLSIAALSYPPFVSDLSAYVVIRCPCSSFF